MATATRCLLPCLPYLPCLPCQSIQDPVDEPPIGDAVAKDPVDGAVGQGHIPLIAAPWPPTSREPFGSHFVAAGLPRLWTSSRVVKARSALRPLPSDLRLLLSD